MTLNELINKYNGKYVEVAGSPNALNQCTDLGNLYIRDCLGEPIVEWTNAIDFPKKLTGPKWEWITVGTPQYGDLMIWKPTPGHIAVFIGTNGSGFTSFDQNFPVGSKCHVQLHTYQNVLGWIRFKGVPMATDIQTYLGVSDDTAAKLRLKEHLGEKDGKCNWGSEGTEGGYLGSERARVKALQEIISKSATILGLAEGSSLDEFYAALKALKDGSNPQKPPTSSPMGELLEEIMVNGKSWTLNGINIVDGKLQGNYMRKA